MSVYYLYMNLLLTKLIKMPSKVKLSKKAVKKLLRNELEGKLTETLRLFTENTATKKYRKAIKKAGKVLSAKIHRERKAKNNTKKIKIHKEKSPVLSAAATGS
jgi:hypothetical protein